MAHKPDYRASFTRMRPTGERVEFEMEIDTYALGHELALRALANESGESRAFSGAVRVRIKPRRVD